jgi:3-deoxy-7-phosphoheptulonate synthase
LLLTEHPLCHECARGRVAQPSAVAQILDRVDDRLPVIVGPCSVHDADAALDYAKLLAEAARELEDDLLV